LLFAHFWIQIMSETGTSAFFAILEQINSAFLRTSVESI